MKSLGRRQWHVERALWHRCCRATAAGLISVVHDDSAWPEALSIVTDVDGQPTGSCLCFPSSFDYEMSKS